MTSSINQAENLWVKKVQQCEESNSITIKPFEKDHVYMPYNASTTTVYIDECVLIKTWFIILDDI